jgi:hypothetical protein
MSGSANDTTSNWEEMSRLPVISFSHLRLPRLPLAFYRVAQALHNDPRRPTNLSRAADRL